MNLPSNTNCLAAEVYFSALDRRQRELPRNVDTPEYDEALCYAFLSEYAFRMLHMDIEQAAERLNGAAGKGMMRPERGGLSKPVDLLKEAIRIGTSLNILKSLEARARAPYFANKLGIGVDRYDVELAHRTLSAFNSLRDLEAGVCVSA